MLKYRLRKLGRKKIIFWSTSILIFVISLASIIRYYAVSHAITPTYSNSRIAGNTVYINDLDADYYYYESLNYTEITDKENLPSGTYTTKYGVGSEFTNRLIAVQINYNGNGGHITSNAQPSNYVYYKYYPIKNGKIDIELIDNPYTNRPTGKGFNGWVCSQTADSVPCSDMAFDLDVDRYVRHVIIPVASNKNSLLVNLDASWVDAKILTSYVASNQNNPTPNNSFLQFGMRRASNVHGLSTQNVFVNYEYYDDNDQYISQAGIYRVVTAPRNSDIAAGNYLVNTNNPLTGTLLTASYHCPNNQNNGCPYITQVPYSNNPRNTSNDYNYNSSYTYYVVGTTTNGITSFNTVTGTDWHQPRIKTRNNVQVTSSMVPAGKNYQTISQWAQNRDLTGYYYRENINTSNSYKYYTENGRGCAATSCSGEQYRRLEAGDDETTWTYETVTLNLPEREVEPVTISVPKFKIDNYYMLVTRDTNIISLASGSYNLQSIANTFSSNSKPYTVTSNYNGAKTTTYVTFDSGGFKASSDMVVENINFNNRDYGKNSNANQTNYSFQANGHNVKIGQNIGLDEDNTASGSTGNRSFAASYVMGSPNKKLIVESGSFIWGSALPTNASSTNSKALTQLGSDYYRAAGIHNTLLFQYVFAGTRYTGNASHNSDTLTPVSNITVKSGTFGNYVLGDGSTTSEGYVYGIYTGALGTSGAGGNGIYRLVVEDGNINCINGGPSVPSDYKGNSIETRVKGGTINNIVGGAGVTRTNANRLVSVTGGQVKYSVAGGSNSSVSGGTNPGPLDSDTLVYIGGNAHIGGGTGELFYSTAGNVFGAGLGRSDSTNRGIVNNSHVIVTGGTIDGNVYGGGNYGATGTQSDDETTTIVDIHKDALIKGSVYGAANNNGAGSDGSNTTSCSCSSGVCLNNSYYVSVGTGRNAPANAEFYARQLNPTGRFQIWSVYDYFGNSNIGNNCNSGNCTFYAEVTANSNYNSATSYFDLSQEGYAWNPTYYLQSVTPNTCTVSSGSNYKHEIRVNMDGGNVQGSVYGGSNTKGNVYGDVIVNITSGTVTNDVFGGGRGGVNGMSTNNITSGTVVSGNVTVNIGGDAKVANVYGGSAEGRVNGTNAATELQTNVNISGGTISGAVYGCGKGVAGNNARPYTFGQSHVYVTGGTMGYVYGGNNASGTVYHSSDVELKGGTITNDAFGGGNNVAHSTSTEITTNVLLNGATVNGSVFGGSNQSGANNTTNVTVESGTAKNIFGGNNAGGSVTTTNVVVNGITKLNGDVFGGGYSASTTTSNVTINNNVELRSNTNELRSVYGGGYSATTTTTHALVNSGTMKSVFGGGYSANADTTRVVVKNGTINEVYGGSNQTGIVTNSYVYISNGDLDAVFGGNNAGGSTNTSHVYIGNGDITNVYGGGNAVYTGATNVEIYGGTMQDVFGGDNNVTATGATNQTNIHVYGGTVNDVYGGSNQNGGVTNTNVYIENGSSGPNCPQPTTGTGVALPQCYTIQSRTVHDVYGGNNVGGYSANTLVKVKDNATVHDVFGGGNNAKVTGTTDVRLYSGSVNHVFGGGNHSFVGDAVEDSEGAFDPTHTSGQAGTTRVYIANGNVAGNVYGSGNSSFVYGNTFVYIGKKALDVINADLPNGSKITNPSIDIDGSVFGGSETNSEGDTQWTFSYKGVIGNTNINVDGRNEYNKTSIDINGSLFGSGNNAATQGIAKIYVTNIGTHSNIKSLASIQRADYVYLTDSEIELRGARDRAQPTKYTYGLARVNALYMLGSSNTNGTTLHMGSGAEYLGQDWSAAAAIEDNHNGYFSGKMNVPAGHTDLIDLSYYSHDNFVPQGTDISNAGAVTNTNSNNKLFMYTNVVFSVANADEPDYADKNTVSRRVEGMTYFGMYNKENDTYRYGMYDTSLASGANLNNVQMLSGNAYSFVYGKHNRDELIPGYIENDPEKEQAQNEHDYDIQVHNNGFYSHYKDETDDTKMKIAYVPVKPIDQKYYKWVLGEEPLDIKVELQATKASVDSAQSAIISLAELKESVNGAMKDWADAKVTILDVDTSGFKASSNVKTPWDAYLVDRTQIPTVANGSTTINGYTVTDANRYFALSMGTSTSGWLDNYRTNIYDPNMSLSPGDNFCSENSVGECVGSEEYTYDSTRNTRSLSFWLYYSKNLDFDLFDGDLEDDLYEIPLGDVYVYTEFFNPHGDPTQASNTQPVRIVVEISMVDSKTAKYGAAITAGKQFEAFDSTPPTISNTGSFSIYQMLSTALVPDGTEHGNDVFTVKELYPKAKTVDGKTYSDGYRYLKSDVALPVGTKITMLDLATNEEYYYDVTSLKTPTNGVYRYMLEDFSRMSTKTTSNKYDDNMLEEQSTKYYKVVDGREVAVEEFIFTVDFSEVNPSNWPSSSGHYLYLESAQDITTGGVTTTKVIMLPSNGNPEAELTYNIVNGATTAINSTGEFVGLEPDENDSVSIYKRDVNTVEIDTSLTSTGSISPTEFDDYKLGAKITILQKDGAGNYNLVTSDLFGTVVTINTVNGTEVFYPQVDGSIRLRLAGRVADVASMIDLDFSNSDLSFGDYMIKIETFPSYDGLYAASTNVATTELKFKLLNSNYGINATVPPVEVTHDVNTGKDKNGNLEMTFNLTTLNGLANPNVKIHLERRDYNDNYDTTYTRVPLDGIAQSLVVGSGNNVLNSCFAYISQGKCGVYNLIPTLDSSAEQQQFTVKLKLKEGPTAEDKANMADAKWKSGTYRVVFDMYDGNKPIGSVYEYLIIRSLDIDEEVEGS